MRNLKNPFSTVFFQDVNWARAGLGLPLLSLERKPVPVPSGPRPSPEGEAGPVSGAGTRDRGDTVLSVGEAEVSTTRRQTLDPAVADLAKSPLITGDPDSEGNKYRRRPPTDWLLRSDLIIICQYRSDDEHIV